ncbi:glycosyltransferase, partial [Candidatus Pacearchaeota archaeon]|nr:glycosyltransferase [Candidatus Pacearchaeota archaeon]
MFSVIIPAHNEEKVIGRTLEHLLTGKFTDEVEVIVVCNGCSDKTTKIVKSFQGSAKCIETPIPSKTSALNLGDAAAKGFPRIYQDADVILSLDAVHKISKILLAG